MRDAGTDSQQNDSQGGNIGRRDGAAGIDLVETVIEIKTPDGTCDAAFIRPKSRSHPGVFVWPDAFGLRTAMRDIGKRIAAEGSSVRVPNQFYRISKAPVSDASHFNFDNPADRAKFQPLNGLRNRVR